jgi:hypothetical protein
MQGVLAKRRAVLLKAFLHFFINSTLDPNVSSIVEVPGLGALEPYELATGILGHDHLPAC